MRARRPPWQTTGAGRIQITCGIEGIVKRSVNLGRCCFGCSGNLSNRDSHCQRRRHDHESEFTDVVPHRTNPLCCLDAPRVSVIAAGSRWSVFQASGLQATDRCLEVAKEARRGHLPMMRQPHDCRCHRLHYDNAAIIGKQALATYDPGIASGCHRAARWCVRGWSCGRQPLPQQRFLPLTLTLTLPLHD